MADPVANVLSVLKSCHNDAIADPNAQAAFARLVEAARDLWPYYVRALNTGRLLQIASAATVALVKGPTKK